MRGDLGLGAFTTSSASLIALFGGPLVKSVAVTAIVVGLAIVVVSLCLSVNEHLHRRSGRSRLG